MTEPYPVELRTRVVAAYEAGEGSYPVIASLFSLGEATVRRWVSLYRKDGDVSPRRNPRGRKAKVSKRELCALLDEMGDANAGELTAAFNRERRGANRIHVSTMKRALHRNGFVVKKRGGARSNSFGPTSSRSARRSSAK
jgi:transposase